MLHILICCVSSMVWTSGARKSRLRRIVAVFPERLWPEEDIPRHFVPIPIDASAAHKGSSRGSYDPASHLQYLPHANIADIIEEPTLCENVRFRERGAAWWQRPRSQSAPPPEPGPAT